MQTIETPTLTTIMAINLQKGGFQHWDAILGRIESVNPDIVALNEATGWGEEGKIEGIERELGMKILLADSRSKDPTGIMYKEDKVSLRLWDMAVSQELHHGLGTANLDIVGFPEPVSLSPVHHNPYAGVGGAKIEAGHVTGRALRHTTLAVLMGDFNYAPAFGLRPNFKFQGPHNDGTRNIHRLFPFMPRRPDRGLGRQYREAGFKDIAWERFKRTLDLKYLERTAASDRIDWALVSAPLLKAVVDFRIVTDPEGPDHGSPVLTLDGSKVDMRRARRMKY